MTAEILPGPLAIGPAATRILRPAADYAAEFAAHRSIVCPGLLEPGLLAAILRMISHTRFESQAIKDLGHRDIEEPMRVGAAMTLALRRPNFFRWLEEATGCLPLGEVSGQLGQSRVGADHRLDWHNDVRPGRCLAMTVNLSEADYEGGMFELRETRSHAVLRRHLHAEPGSALIFEVSTACQHRLDPITAGGPRRIYTGWFVTRDALDADPKPLAGIN